MRFIPSREQINKALHEKNAVQRALARKSFRVWEALGLHVTADHFYEPIPSTRTVRNQYIEGPRACIGIDFRFDETEKLTLEMMQRIKDELQPALRRTGYQPGNFYFGITDALCLYGMLRHHKPPRVIEVGRGSSTLVATAALLANKAEGHNPRFVSIDPFPRLDGRESFHGLDADIRIANLETSADFILETIQSGDLLFIDSSHVFKFGSDVQVLFEKVLPMLPAGALVHVHDVFSPFDYPKEWMLNDRRFWNEQYILEAFLRFNSAFAVLLPSHYLFRTSDPIRAAHKEWFAFTSDPPESCSSFYFQRIA